MTRLLRLLAAAGACVGVLACGNSSSSGSGTVQNTMTFTIDAGPANSYFNGGFATVTVCTPGSTSQCQTISGVLIDTGSSGLRLLKSVLTVPLTQQNASNGNPIVECNQFLDGYTWGPVQLADVKLAGEHANSVPIQVIDESQFPTVPSECTSSGLSSEDTLQSLAANGVLGIGLFRQDCGPACALTGSNNPGIYFQCPSGTCSVASVGTAAQVQNPVWMFAHDNNGVVMTIPTIAAPGLVTATGTLVFGIGTQSNNALGSARVYTTNGAGDISTSFQGKTYDAFIDSGSNGYYFLDSATTGLPTCSDAKDFYCPSSSVTLNANNIGANGTNTAVTWRIDNADSIPNQLNVLPTIGGTSSGTFDWGLPFFFGRTVFTGLEGQASPAGTGPYFAY